MFDMHTISVRAQISALEQHRELVERTISETAARRTEEVDELSREGDWHPDDPEWDIAYSELRFFTGHQLPMFFRNPLILMSWAAYETGVTEIADHTSSLLSSDVSSLSIGDLRGGFTDRAKKYFKTVVPFALYTDESQWNRLMVLYKLRNAIAHAGGRTDRLSKGVRDKIEKLEEEGLEVYTRYEKVTVSEAFLRETVGLVRAEVTALLSRFKAFKEALPSTEVYFDL